MRLIIATIWMILLATAAEAVTSQDIRARYSLVGVIAAEREDEQSIVVIKDVVSHRSMTVKVGQPLPHDKRWTVTEVYRTSVLLTDGNERVRVSYNSATAVPETPPSSYADPTRETYVVQVEDTIQETAPSNYDNRNSVEYLDNLVSNRESLQERSAGEDPMEALDEYELHLRRELKRVQEEKSERSADDIQADVTEYDDNDSQEPVFSDKPDGPTYFH